MGNKELKTFKEWQRKYIDEFWIMDPDGFPRSDPNFDNLLYTEEDFLKRMGKCTCKFGKRIPEDIKKMIRGDSNLTTSKKNHHLPGIALEEGNLSKDAKRSNLPRTITMSVSGTHMSHNKCPECGKYMEFHLNMDLDNRIDSTSSYTIHYRCESGHKFKMTVDEAIDKYGAKL